MTAQGGCALRLQVVRTARGSGRLQRRAVSRLCNKPDRAVGCHTRPRRFCVSGTEYLTLEDLLGFVRRLGIGPVRDWGLLVSAVARPMSNAFGEDAHPKLERKPTAFLDSIAIRHALVDGNKRLGWLATAGFLDTNREPAELPDDDAFHLVLVVAEGDPDVDDIGALLTPRWTARRGRVAVHRDRSRATRQAPGETQRGTRKSSWGEDPMTADRASESSPFPVHACRTLLSQAIVHRERSVGSPNGIRERVPRSHLRHWLSSALRSVVTWFRLRRAQTGVCINPVRCSPLPLRGSRRRCCTDLAVLRDRPVHHQRIRYKGGHVMHPRYGLRRLAERGVSTTATGSIKCHPSRHRDEMYR
jgi:death-on-curing protein